ncbi:MAG: hypothetical protein IJF83_09330 [Methanobrevibacter sp.]|nr:hypothetical protein [Methanobrevibacter sp.]
MKNNPYGIKCSFHGINRAKKRGIDLNVVNEYIFKGKLVGIEKSFNEIGIFQLLFEHTKKYDLAIVIKYWITVIEKSVNKRKHYEF